MPTLSVRMSSNGKIVYRWISTSVPIDIKKRANRLFGTVNNLLALKKFKETEHVNIDISFIVSKSKSLLKVLDEIEIVSNIDVKQVCTDALTKGVGNI